VYLKDVQIANSPVGISGDISNSTLEDVSFKNVGVPYDVHGENFSITGTRIEESDDFRIPSEPRQIDKPESSGGAKYKLSGRDRPVGAPASCRTCGAVFSSHRYTIMNARFFLSDDNQEICLRCGSDDAFLAEGLLDLLFDSVRLIQGPVSTARMIQLLVGAKGELAQNGYVDPDEFFGQLASVAPNNDIAKKSEEWTRDQKLTMVGILVAVLGSVYVILENEVDSQPIKFLYRTVSEAIYQAINSSDQLGNEDPDKHAPKHPSDVSDPEEISSGSDPIDV